MSREDLDRFMTPASRALVDQFMADTADEPDDVDMDEVVRQNLADHEAALTGEQSKLDVVALLRREAEHVRQEMAAADPQAGLADLKRRLKPPKPFVGYLVENADFSPPPRTKISWLYHLPPAFYTIQDAQAYLDGCRAVSQNTSTRTILKVTVTFETVEDGTDG